MRNSTTVTKKVKVSHIILTLIGYSFLGAVFLGDSEMYETAKYLYLIFRCCGSPYCVVCDKLRQTTLLAVNHLSYNNQTASKSKRKTIFFSVVWGRYWEVRIAQLARNSSSPLNKLQGSVPYLQNPTSHPIAVQHTFVRIHATCSSFYSFLL